MSENKKSECKIGGCGCNLNSDNMPAVIGTIVVYELAAIIALLLFIYIELSKSEETEETEE